jgi:hypothetical protein
MAERQGACAIRQKRSRVVDKATGNTAVTVSNQTQRDSKPHSLPSHSQAKCMASTANKIWLPPAGPITLFSQPISAFPFPYTCRVPDVPYSVRAAMTLAALSIPHRFLKTKPLDHHPVLDITILCQGTQCRNQNCLHSGMPFPVLLGPPFRIPLSTQYILRSSD